MADSVDELKSSRSIQGEDFQNFEMLDARISCALNKIIQNSYFKKKVSLEEQKTQKEDRFLRGRQIAFMIYDNFRVTGAHDTVLDYANLFTITLRNDDVQEFDTRWDERRLRNFDARNERIETGAVVTTRRGQRGVESGQGECYQWKAQGQCSRGDTCSFRDDQDKRAKPTPKTAPSSEPPTPRGVEVRREKRSLRGRSLSGKTNRQPCKNLLKGTCAELPCDYWHPPNVSLKSQNRVVNSAKSIHFRTGMLRNNQIKGRRRVVTKVKQQ